VLYNTPPLTGQIRSDLAELDELRRRLGSDAGAAGPWLGSLRRQVRASSAESSISIEGFRVPEADAVAIVDGQRPTDPDDAGRNALACYARAMDHVGVMALDPRFQWVDRVILDLHFDACWFQRDNGPGLLRTGPIGVTAPGGGTLAYEGPPADDVPGLMDEVVQWLEQGDLDAHVVVRAAMAHLHLVSIHPFQDGNGRIARIAQSLVLARERLLTPELGSIEEYLGHHTDAYYAKLQEVQGGRYQPRRDAGAWVEFCVSAHLAQARQRLRQVAEAAARWRYLEELVERRGWPERIVIALEQSLFGGAERTSYGIEAGVSLATASADLRRLVDAGLVERRGRTRSARYIASDGLRREIGVTLGDSGARCKQEQVIERQGGAGEGQRDHDQGVHPLGALSGR